MLRPILYFLVIMAVALFLGLGCGAIADKDRIVIARVDGETITRGDLSRHLREMDDADRPLIRNRSDLLRTLNQWIDERITVPLGEQLAAEGQITVPREHAQEQFFQSLGQDGDQLRFIYSLDLDNLDGMTNLMNVYQLTPEIIRARKDFIDLRIDEIIEKMQGQAAVAYLAGLNYQSGELQPDQQRIQREYELRRSELTNHEWMSFRAFRFPQSLPDALEQAATVRHRLDAGEDWDVLEDEYYEINEDFIIESEIENNPGLERFRGFWLEASEAQPDDILGPIYLPSYQVVMPNAQGHQHAVEMPAAYIVLRVLESEAERMMTQEEALPILLQDVLISQQLRKLRDEHNVEVYEDRLFDPAQFMADPSPFGF